MEPPVPRLNATGGNVPVGAAWRRGRKLSRTCFRSVRMMLPGHHSPRIFPLRRAQDAFSAGLFRSPSSRIRRPEGNTMILAPLAAAAFLATVATAPHANPTLVPALSMQQRSAAMQPLMRSATECIASTVSADPRFGKPNADLGDLIVDSMPHCATQVRMMIEAYDRYFR